MQDTSYPTRDWTRAPALGAQSPNHWTTREVPLVFLVTAILTGMRWYQDETLYTCSCMKGLFCGIYFRGTLPSAQYVKRELPDVQAGFRKERNHRSNCQHPLDHRKSKRIPENHLLLLHWLYQSLWRCGSQQTGKFWKRWEYQTTLPASWEICMQVKKQQLEPDMEQQTGSKSGKECIKVVYCHPACLTSMKSTSSEMLDWMKHK